MPLLATINEANQQYYAAAAQVIPVLLLAAAVGEARLKVRNLVNFYAAMILIFIVGAVIAAGEIAALRALVTGEDSRRQFALTTLSIGLGLGFVIQYLAFAAYRDIAGADAQPTSGVSLILVIGGMVIGTGTVVGLVA